MHEWNSDGFSDAMNIIGCKSSLDSYGAMMTRQKPGRPRRRGPTKVPVTIRLDADVLEALKDTGPGWQTRVNQVIRRWIIGEVKPDSNP
jgi:uncharacterized protein (DUF4415 family)